MDDGLRVQAPSPRWGEGWGEGERNSIYRTIAAPSPAALRAATSPRRGEVETAAPLATEASHADPVRLAQIGADHVLVALDLFRDRVGDLAAVIEHDHAVGQIHHHAHIVLDQRDRGAVMVVHVENEARHVLLLL